MSGGLPELVEQESGEEEEFVQIMPSVLEDVEESKEAEEDDEQLQHIKRPHVRMRTHSGEDVRIV
eukprot:UN27262